MIKKVDSSLLWQQDDSWRLQLDKLKLPNGRILQKAAVSHPGAVVLIPLRPSAQGPEILMLRQYRHVLDQTILELPAGTRGWEEDWLTCAQRELREETGYQAQTFTPLGQIWPAPGISDELMQLYLAEHLTPAPLPGDEDELIEVVPMRLAELVEMGQNGRLQDAKIIISIFRTAYTLKLA
mgnify:CR=1 FL=1